MEAIAPGRQAVTRVRLHPRIDWIGAAPDAERLAELHAEAHETCFIANSVRTRVSWPSRWARRSSEDAGGRSGAPSGAVCALVSDSASLRPKIGMGDSFYC